MEITYIKIKNLVENTGQIEGLPKNPRFIKDERFKKLVKSIQDDPEMLEMRECLVVPFGDKFVVIAGNMRFKACKELGYAEIACKVLDPKTPVQKLKAITIKDNVPFGDHDWDLLANEWDSIELFEWGLELPEIEIPEVEDDGDKESEAKAQFTITVFCENESEQHSLFEDLEKRGLKCKIEFN